MWRTRKGFTLIELLVVIAIIAILAAILFPVFITVKARAKGAHCLSNLRQVGVAASLYVPENGGRFPPWLSEPGNLLAGGWFVVLKKYARTPMLGYCPASPDKYRREPPMVTYWRNAYTDYWSNGFYSVPPPSETVITYPRTTVFLMDGPNYGDGNHTWWGPPTTWGGDSRYPGPYRTFALEAETRHGGGANVLFCDWHVALVKPGGFASDLKNTPEGDPMYAAIGVLPPEPWCDKNDGRHPSFRSN